MAYVPSPYEKDLEKIVRGIRNAHDRLTALAAADITDYAEGSFTPAISFGGGTTGITYTPVSYTHLTLPTIYSV